MKALKPLIATLLTICTLSLNLNAQSLSGAWLFMEGNKSHQLFFQDGLYFYTVHEGNTFLMSQGGKYSISDKTIKTESWYNSSDSSKVAKVTNFPFTLTENSFALHLDEGTADFERIDNGKAPLAGVWRITGRMGNDGKVTPIHQTGTRQTYKLLTGTKFQWVAIDPAKKQFSGTGGGSYTFKDGKYTENIEFFSRDNSRVGASLSFDGKLDNGSWHHSGLSIKGDKIYEVWGRVN